jgi:hypothetical protein
MSITVSLPPDLEARVLEQANRAHGGDVSALAAAGLAFYLGLVEQQRLLNDRYAGDPGEADEARLARALAAERVSSGTIEAVVRTLSRAAGLVPSLGSDGSAAPSPTEYVQRYLAWANATPQVNIVGCVVTSAQPASGDEGVQREAITSFAHGHLAASNGMLAGDLRQVFSDRTVGTSADPFDPARPDSVGVNMAIDELTGLITVELVAHTWGDARQTLRNLRIADGVLLGDGESVGNQTPGALYAISLATAVLPPKSDALRKARWYERLLPWKWLPWNAARQQDSVAAAAPDARPARLPDAQQRGH